MNPPISLNTNEEVKSFITETLKDHDGSHLEAREVLDFVYSSKTSIKLDSYSERKKEIDLGKEIIPRKGSVYVVNNEFWELQDIGLKNLFPELSESADMFEFLITIVYQVKYNKKTDKVEILQGRYKFSTEIDGLA